MFRGKKKLDGNNHDDGRDSNNKNKRDSPSRKKGMLRRKPSAQANYSNRHDTNGANVNSNSNDDDDDDDEYDNPFLKKTYKPSNNRDNQSSPNSKPSNSNDNSNSNSNSNDNNDIFPAETSNRLDRKQKAVAKASNVKSLSPSDAFKPLLPTNSHYNDTYNSNNNTNNDSSSNNNKNSSGANRFNRKDRDAKKNALHRQKQKQHKKVQKARTPKPPKIKKYALRDPNDSNAVSELVTYIVPKKSSPDQVRPMDPTSFLNNDSGNDFHNYNAGNGNGNGNTNGSGIDQGNGNNTRHDKRNFYNECLIALRVNKFEVMDQAGKPTTTSTSMNLKDDANSNINSIDAAATAAGTHGHGNVDASDLSVQVSVSGGFRKNMHSINPKNKNKLRYACITRSTNARVLVATHSSGGVMINGVLLDDEYAYGLSDKEHNHDYPSSDEESQAVGSSSDEDNDAANDDYSLLYNPENQRLKNGDEDGILLDDKTPSPAKRKSLNSKARSRKRNDDVPPEKEQSSFPSLVLLAIQSDGSRPDVRQILDLDQLVAIESVANKGLVKLIFLNGIIVELDCDVEDPHVHTHVHARTHGHSDDELFLEKNRFLWSLLQIHAILCTSVVERNLRMANKASTTSGTAISRVHAATALPQLTMRNVDRAELQYISTVNGFLSSNPILCALLERQRNLAVGLEKKDMAGVKHSVVRNRGTPGDMEEKDNGVEVDGIAYDMIMGNFNKLALFTSEEEKNDAEEVLNSTILQEKTTIQSGGSVSAIAGEIADGQEKTGERLKIDDIDTAETLTQLLQKRMRDLEAETCRRLIAWEDEKKFSVNGIAQANRDMPEAQSLSSLFQTLDNLDKELEDMEEWLSDKAAAIKPLTDDCREVEEVNRQLEQQQYSYELLSIELGRLLDGLEVDPVVQEILEKPSSKIVYLDNGGVDIKRSEAGVEEIYNAAKELKNTFDKVEEEGGVHLRAVSERVEGLLDVSNHFCQAVAEIIVAVMRQTIIEVSSNADSKDDKSASHTGIAKSIRSTQRQFQSSLLAYIKLIEILALLKPSMLPSVRDAYANLVSEGILSKKRLKSYFMSLPGKSSVNMDMYTVDLSAYPPVALRSSPTHDPNSSFMKPVQAKDVETALSELLPVIAREAYFTAALFGLSAKHLSGREKKKNFESAKKSVDFSSKHFKYYIKRICGIASEADAEGKKVFADPLLSLVSSILLNEAMDNYIDRQKKGGDHSLSLAYVRATILDLRKRVDRQWVAWIEEQIKWIQASPGVPLNGKRAGVFTTFARFPSYLDHVLICCKAGRPADHVPNLSRIKVIAYYLQKLAAALFNSLHKCSERETTDQQYAANVMRMENSYFFTQTIKQRGSELTELFQKQITAASSICKQSTDAYLGFMIKREFKSLHTLFASISRIRREVGDADVPIHVPRSTFEKTLSKECNRDVLKDKIGAIYYRMEKHLSEAGGLLPVGWKALVKVLYEWFGRWEKLSSQCYKFSLEPSASDVVRIAKQAAGISAKKINEEKQKASAAQG